MPASDRPAAVTGVGESAMARRLPDRTAASLACEAALAAVADAGLRMSDIDGLVAYEGGAFGLYSGAPFDPRGQVTLMETLGIKEARLCATPQMGGASPGFMLSLARDAVREGRCRRVLVLAAGKMSSTAPPGAFGNRTTDALSSFAGHSITYEQPFGPLLLSYYAAVARRHMHEFGTTEEQLAAIAVACREHAARHRQATYRTPITVEDVLASPMISSPLHMLDCSVSSDGGCALVVSRAEDAADAPSRPVSILGCGWAQSDYFMGALAAGRDGFDLVRSVGVEAGRMAFGEAGVRPDEIDVAGIYDSFTITALMGLEDFGFCAKGEGGPFAESGALGPGGALPTNTHGGLLSGMHFGPAGLLHYCEVIHQLRGAAGTRQVDGAELAFAGSIAGVCSTWSCAVLGAN